MVTVDELRTALEQKRTAATEAQAAFEAAMNGRGADRMANVLTAAKALDKANAEVERAQGAITRAEFESKAEERGTASKALEAAVQELLAGEVFTTARQLGVTGFSVSLGEAGTTLVNIRTLNAAGKGTSDGTGRGGSRGTLVHQVDGQQYTSRELLEKYGSDVLGADRMVKVWEARANGAGFDAPVKSLLAKLGEAGREVKLFKRVEGQLVEVQ